MFFVFNLKCFLLHVKQITNFQPPFEQVWINPGAHWGCGTPVQHHSSDECHIVPFFPLVSVSSPVACREGTLLQMELLRCERWLRASPWAAERSRGARGSCRKRRGSCSLLLPFWGLHGLCRTAGDAAASSAATGAFSANPWRLATALPKSGLICSTGNLRGHKELRAGIEGFGMAVWKHTKPFSTIAACGQQELGNQSCPDTNETLNILFWV